jgi:hypothetical protein
MCEYLNPPKTVAPSTYEGGRTPPVLPGFSFEIELSEFSIFSENTEVLESSEVIGLSEVSDISAPLHRSGTAHKDHAGLNNVDN